MFNFKKKKQASVPAHETLHKKLEKALADLTDLQGQLIETAKKLGQERTAREELQEQFNALETSYDALRAQVIPTIDEVAAFLRDIPDTVKKAKGGAALIAKRDALLAKLEGKKEAAE